MFSRWIRKQMCASVVFYHRLNDSLYVVILQILQLFIFCRRLLIVLEFW